VGGVLVLLLAGEEDAPPDPGATNGPAAGSHDRRHWLRRSFSYGFVTLPEDIGKAVLGGLFVAAIITAIVPHDYLASVLPSGPAQILLMMLIGIPIYVCSTASVPVAAALIAAGVSPGAALAFLITGPGTNAATIATIWKVMGRRTTVLYLLTIAVAAFGGGLLLNLISGSVATDAVGHVHQHEMAAQPWYAWPAGIALLAALGGAFVRPLLLRRRMKAAPKARTVTLAVRGMTCNHCRQTVRGALLAVPGVEEAEVDLAAGRAAVQAIDAKPEALASAVREAGYQAELISSPSQPQPPGEPA
jgi:uncharacterized protein